LAVANPLVFQPGDIIFAQLMIWSSSMHHGDPSFGQALDLLSKGSSVVVHLTRHITVGVGQRKTKSNFEQCGIAISWPNQQASDDEVRIVNCETSVPEGVGSTLLFKDMKVEVKHPHYWIELR
jgi:hypothetical protein